MNEACSILSESRKAVTLQLHAVTVHAPGVEQETRVQIDRSIYCEIKLNAQHHFDAGILI